MQRRCIIVFKGVLLRYTYGISEQAERHKSQSFKNIAKKILRNLLGTSYNIPFCKTSEILFHLILLK